MAIAIRINQNWPGITNANYCKFGLKFMKTIGCGKSRDLENKKPLLNTSPDAGL